VRARGWKAGAIGAGDLGFGCARRTKLAGGVHGSAAAGACGGCGGRRRQVGPGASVARARQVRLAAARAYGTRRVGPRAWARGERGLGRGKGHCWLGRLGLDEGEAGPVQGKGEGRGGRARLGRGKGNGPWGKDGLGCFGFGSSFQFYFFFLCKLTQTSLNSNKFEFKLPSTHPK